jgi:hypothetical protein
MSTAGRGMNTAESRMSTVGRGMSTPEGRMNASQEAL